MTRTNQRDGRVPVRQRAKGFADGARRLSHPLPDAALVGWHPRQGDPRLAELCKVRSDQFPPLLPLASLRGEAGGHFTHIFQNGAGILCLRHLTISMWRAPIWRARSKATTVFSGA